MPPPGGTSANISYGILTERDIVYNIIALGKYPSLAKVTSVMRHPCIELPPEATVQEAAQLLSDAGIHRAPVIQDRQLLGMLSVTDIIEKCSESASALGELSLVIEEAGPKQLTICEMGDIGFLPNAA